MCQARVYKERKESPHVLDNESHLFKQAALTHRLDTVDHWGKILTAAATVYGVLLAVGYFYQVRIEG